MNVPPIHDILNGRLGIRAPAGARGPDPRAGAESAAGRRSPETNDRIHVTENGGKLIG